MSTPSPERFDGTLSLVLFVGAARADATPEQLEQLREHVLPLVDAMREDGDVRPLLNTVLDVMGPNWNITGEWKQLLDRLLPGVSRNPEGDSRPI